MKHPVSVTVTIATDGTISAECKTPDDFEHARDPIMSIMAAVAGDNPIAYSDCLGPETTEAVAQRLAKMLMGEVV